MIARVHLDWRDKSHYAPIGRACRLCGVDAHTLDAQGRACHKTCAEIEAAEELTAARGAYFRDERVVQLVRPGDPDEPAPRLVTVSGETLPTPAQVTAYRSRRSQNWRWTA